MSTKNDKWVMFRNYMTNELGITKDDIRQWIREVIQEEVKNVVKQAYGECNIEKLIKREIYSYDCWDKQFKSKVYDAIAKELVKSINISVNNTNIPNNVNNI